MKKLMIALAAVALLAAPACKKKEKEEPKPATTETTKTETATKPANPCANPCGMAKLDLTGTPSENMVKVFAAGVKALDGKEPAAAAAALQGMLKMYDVADLRAKSKAAKDAGEGASDETKAKFAAAKEAYKKLAAELGTKDAAAFGPAAQAWAEAWGIK